MAKKYSKVWLPLEFEEVKKEVKYAALELGISMGRWILDAVKEKLLTRRDSKF